MNLKIKQKNKIKINSPPPPSRPLKTPKTNKQKSEAPGVRKYLINSIESTLDCARDAFNYLFLLLVLTMLFPPF